MPPLSCAVQIVVAAIAIAVAVFLKHQQQPSSSASSKSSTQWISEELLRSTGLLIFQPDKFQGASKTHRYFEGWYYKFVSADNGTDAKIIRDDSIPHDEGFGNSNNGSFSMAVVPGIFLGATPTSNESHAFVFVTLNGERQYYFRFGLDEFTYAKSDGTEEYFIRVGNNWFGHEGVSLDLSPRRGYDYNSGDDNHGESIILLGNLTFSDPSPWPVSLLGLGAMGPVGWMPRLECTHGVLSFDQIFRGSLTLRFVGDEKMYFGGTNSNNGDEEQSKQSFQSSQTTTISMDDGRGYTEKDYGRSFPSLWIWIQTNSFSHHPGTSLFVSIARIPTPLFGLEFPGFTAAVWHDGALLPFATWSGAKFEKLEVSEERVYIVMRSGRSWWSWMKWRNWWSGTKKANEYRVELTIDRRNVPEVLLYAPVNFTRMEPFVWEVLLAKVHMRLFELLDGHEYLIVDDVGKNAGLEVHGDVGWLVDNVCGKAKANRLICL